MFRRSVVCSVLLLHSCCIHITFGSGTFNPEELFSRSARNKARAWRPELPCRFVGLWDCGISGKARVRTACVGSRTQALLGHALLKISFLGYWHLRIQNLMVITRNIHSTNHGRALFLEIQGKPQPLTTGANKGKGLDSSNATSVCQNHN